MRQRLLAQQLDGTQEEKQEQAGLGKVWIYQKWAVKAILPYIMSAMANLSGRSVQGYDLLERIGAGGFGAVYRAYQSTVGREVAVKVILPAFANRPDFIRRFEFEAQLIARLEHLHVVPLYDYWRDPEGAYIVMRWLRGGSLSAALRSGAFGLGPATLLLDQVAAGLAAAHQQQIVHRDLKPSNILLDEEGNAYLADFGIARDLRRTNGAGDGRRAGEASGGKILGSIQYLSPEQLRGHEATPASDIYSLGVTLFELLSGSHPFSGLHSVQQLFKQIDEPLPRIETLEAAVSEAVNEVVQKATAKNPKQRYQDPLALAVAFRSAAGLDRNGHSADLVESLTRREQEILHLIIEGNTNQQIAQNLFLELSTIKWHINRLYKKLGVRSRVQAIVRARELDLIVTPVEPESELEDARQASASVVLPEPVNPYKGLRAFEPADSRDFFGREAAVERLLSRLAPAKAGGNGAVARHLASDGAERFLAIVGPSGSGKSSLLKAGLIPALWSGQLPGSEKWFVVDMLPGSRPLDDLEVALTRIAADKAGNLRAHLDRDAHGLTRAAALILPNDDSELVLIVDQLEELFTMVDDESARDHFLDLIHGAVTDPRSRVRAVVSLRADYYDRPLQYAAFGELVRRGLETLLPLSAGELERAIANPARQAGVAFEPGLVATIIEEVNYRPGALPLLQFALAELFEQREGRVLTHAAYQVLGGSAGALARRAEELFQEQDLAGREAIRQMFLRLVSVVSPATGSASDLQSPADMRRRVLHTQLLSSSKNPARLDEIIDTFAAYRLLTLDHHAASRQATVEVAHEAILREWDRLQGWLEESLADLRLHQQLVRASREWIAAGRDPSFLLRGTRLDQFDNWLQHAPLALNEDEKAILVASLHGREQRVDAERERQEQEAYLERQSNRRLRALVGVMAVALLVAIGLTIAAISFARRAEDQRLLVEETLRLNVSQDLASAARTKLGADPELSLLLALKAAEATYTVDGFVLPEVEKLLRRALQADQVRLTIEDSGLLATSPDGNTLALGKQNGVVRLFDLTTGRNPIAPVIHRPLIRDLAFSPDGRYLATSNYSPVLNIWDVTSGAQLGKIQARSAVSALAFSPGANVLATASDDGQIQFWELELLFDHPPDRAEPVQLAETAPGLQAPTEVANLAFSPDGRRLAALIPGLSAIIWDTATGEQLLEVVGVSDFTSKLTFSPDGNALAGGSGDVWAEIWDAATGEVLLQVQGTSTLRAVAYSPDGKALATAAENGVVTIWQVDSGQELLRLTGHSAPVNSLSFGPDGLQLVSSGEDGATQVWDLRPPSRGEFLEVAAHVGEVYDAVYSPDASMIATAGADGEVNLWDGLSGEQLLSFSGRRDHVFFPTFDPDGGRLAAANPEGGVSIWDVATGQELLALRGDARAYTAVTFSPDGSRVAAGGQEGLANIWNASTGEQLVAFRNDSEIIRLVYDLEGKRIWTYDSDGFAMSWDAFTGEKFPITFESASRNVCASFLWDAELTQDGRLWSAAGDRTAHVYKADGNPEDEPAYSRLLSLRGHSGEVTGVAFNPDGSILASSSSDGTVKLWDMSKGKEVMTLAGPSPSLGGVDFSPDGSFLVTAGSDGTIVVFVITIEELMKTARSRLSRDFTNLECQTYLHQPDGCLNE